METLREIDEAEAARRTRAFKYGKAKDEDWKSREALANLEARLAAPRPDIAALTEISKLARDIPAGLSTIGDRLTPGGQNLQAVIVRECENALARFAKQRAELEASLEPAKDRVAKAEARLAEFED
jgi:hypothetical protein